jgi:sulfatase modifying factor 1
MGFAVWESCIRRARKRGQVFLATVIPATKISLVLCYWDNPTVKNPLMSKTGIVVALTLFLVTGCGKNDTDQASADKAGVVELPTVRPRSGGEMVLVPPGTFTMGDSAGQPDETPHNVSVSPFYIDKFAITQEQYQKILGVNPSKRKDAQCPVEGAQWTEAVRFCNACSQLDGLTPCYDLDTWECNFNADGYRLPTEAEWEYACRAGSASRYSYGDDEMDLAARGWFKPHSQGKAHPVGQKLPNRWGLFDMHGNVWQWCNDWYSDIYYKEGPAKDPRGPVSGILRVLRGGAWDCTAAKCRSAYRHKEFQAFTDACFGVDSYGFRRVRKGDGGGKTPPAAVEPTTVIVSEKKTDKKGPGVAVTAQGKLDRAMLRGTIAFVSDRGGSLKIWSMRANGQDAKQLTKSEGADADPHFAPDGKRILYTTVRGGFPEIWIMNRDGSEPKFVTKGSQASWAPDGKSIIFIEDNQTVVRDLATNQEKRVTPKEWQRCGVPAFNPDGKSFAVASRHLKDIGIFILSLDGKECRQLPTEEACCTPHWSKDGKKILCQSVQGHIHHVGVDGKGWDQLTAGADVQHDACYSPDGTMIAFCRAPAPQGPWRICVQRVEDEDFVELTPDGSNNLQPDWHGD